MFRGSASRGVNVQQKKNKQQNIRQIEAIGGRHRVKMLDYHPLIPRPSSHVPHPSPSSSSSHFPFLQHRNNTPPTRLNKPPSTTSQQHTKFPVLSNSGRESDYTYHTIASTQPLPPPPLKPDLCQPAAMERVRVPSHGMLAGTWFERIEREVYKLC